MNPDLSRRDKMPAHLVVKQYLADSYYHVFNRGAHKLEVFLAEADYQTFYSLVRRFASRNGVEIIVFALMPNHFHFVLFQTEERRMVKFMRSLCTAYVMYFRKKYNHSGHLFQGVYKAVLLGGEGKLFKSIEYVLNNPAAAGYANWRWAGYFKKFRKK